VMLALEPSGVTVAEGVWFVGDTGVDILCARNSGCVPVLLGDGLPEEGSFRYEPQLVFSDGATLFDFVQGL
jgi:phosphoglycolate phosphatase